MIKPLVSIIIPTFNSAKSLVTTVNSVLSQVYLNLEIIIVDDGSSDNTSEIVSELILKDGRISFFRRTDNQRKGGSVCRNIGLNNANGKYVVFLDSDDLLGVNCIQQRVEIMTKEDNLDFAVFKMQIFYTAAGDSQTLAVNFNVKDPLESFLKNSFPYPWHTTSPIWKKSFLLKIGGFNENYPRMQDPELHTRVLLLNDVKYKLCVENPVDCYYRQDHKTESIQSRSVKFLEGFFIYITDFIPLVKNYDAEHKTNYRASFRHTFWNVFKGIKADPLLIPQFKRILTLGREENVISKFDFIVISLKFSIKTTIYKSLENFKNLPASGIKKDIQ